MAPNGKGRKRLETERGLKLRMHIREELGEIGEKLHALAGQAEKSSAATIRATAKTIRALANLLFDLREPLKREPDE